jgi:hypothetical protein
MRCEIEKRGHSIHVPTLSKLSALPDTSQYPSISLTSCNFSRFCKRFSVSDRQALIAISMLFAVEVMVKGLNHNIMNAQIWLKGVTAGLELEDLAELDIPLIGGVRGLCSIKFSEGLRVEEGT